jgi:hypothetical protein
MLVNRHSWVDFYMNSADWMKKPNVQTSAEATKSVKVVLVGLGASMGLQKSAKGENLKVLMR